MQISVFGRTDKRVCVYTLMKLLQQLGDTALVTDDRHCKRLTEDGEAFGHYQNISIFVCDTTADAMWDAIGHAPQDFDHIILDNLYNEHTDLTIYVEGGGPEPLDEDVLEVIDDVVKIKLGAVTDAVPYTKELMEALEHVEYYRQLKPLSPVMSRKLAQILSPHLGIPAKQLIKVVNKK